MMRVCFIGGFGVDFSVDTGNMCAGLCKVACGILQHGVTSFCPTVVTSKPATYKKVCKFYNDMLAFGC